MTEYFHQNEEIFHKTLSDNFDIIRFTTTENFQPQGEKINLEVEYRVN